MLRCEVIVHPKLRSMALFFCNRGSLSLLTLHVSFRRVYPYQNTLRVSSLLIGSSHGRRREKQRRDGNGY
jgi:hypothetical protein